MSLAAKKAAKKALLSQPATTEPQEGPQGQAGDQSLAAGLNPTEDSEVVVLGEVSNSNGHPSGVPGVAPPPKGVPTIQTPQVNFQPVANPMVIQEVMVIQEWRSKGVSTWPLPTTTVVSSVSTEDKEVVAIVEGNQRVPSQGVLEAVATPILGLRV